MKEGFCSSFKLQEASISPSRHTTRTRLQWISLSTKPLNSPNWPSRLCPTVYDTHTHQRKRTLLPHVRRTANRDFNMVVSGWVSIFKPKAGFSRPRHGSETRPQIGELNFKRAVSRLSIKQADIKKDILTIGFSYLSKESHQTLSAGFRNGQSQTAISRRPMSLNL